MNEQDRVEISVNGTATAKLDFTSITKRYVCPNGHVQVSPAEFRSTMSFSMTDDEGYKEKFLHICPFCWYEVLSKLPQLEEATDD